MEVPLDQGISHIRYEPFKSHLATVSWPTRRIHILQSRMLRERLAADEDLVAIRGVDSDADEVLASGAA